ncbi:NAD(P)-binding domain-containing protein [Streptomyces niveus]|uniref:NAD(P)-binding domain-containing protein n=1 Tax=Streptomyces niveus TaxID=193462 RepID=A0ABZ2AJI3_STRNV|nr:NAD(P)-binding domain-containing protein [Streptomyces niveus]WTA57225.1 NAD(P)-binding domain-containing protein [Streptomyces niveus]
MGRRHSATHGATRSRRGQRQAGPYQRAHDHPGRRGTMRIGIIGAGRIGSTLARHFAGIGHDVALANSRGPETLTELVAGIGGPLRAVSAEEAARFGQVVVVSIPYGHIRDLPAAQLRDKVVIDTCNYYPQRDGHEPDLDDDSTTSSEKVRALTDSNLVKAFNAIAWEVLRDRGRPKGDPARLAIPISGDDEEAVAVVAGLIRDIGFDPVNAGHLGGGGRKHQPDTDGYLVELSAHELDARLHKS